MKENHSRAHYSNQRNRKRQTNRQTRRPTDRRTDGDTENTKTDRTLAKEDRMISRVIWYLRQGIAASNDEDSFLRRRLPGFTVE